MLHVCHSPTHLFSHVPFSLSSLCQLEQLSHLQQSPVPLQFLLPGVVIATDVMPNHWAFYFEGSGLPLSVSGSWSGSLCRAHISLQELHAGAMILHGMVFHLYGKVVVLHLVNSTAKAYLCNQGGMVSPFLSRQAYWILSLTDKHGITLIPAHIPTCLKVEVDCPRIRCFQSGIFSLRWLRQLFHLWGLPEVELLASFLSTQCQHYYTLETPLPLRALGLNAFNHPWMFQVSYTFTPALIPLVLSKFPAEYVKGQLRLLILVALCWMEVP